MRSAHFSHSPSYFDTQQAVAPVLLFFEAQGREKSIENVHPEQEKPASPTKAIDMTSTGIKHTLDRIEALPPVSDSGGHDSESSNSRKRSRTLPSASMSLAAVSKVPCLSHHASCVSVF